MADGTAIGRPVAEAFIRFYDGGAVLTGAFFGASTFGPGEGGETTLTAAGGSDIFVARFAGESSGPPRALRKKGLASRGRSDKI